MTDGQLHQISEAIGGLKSSVENIHNRLDNSSQDRRCMQKKVDEILETSYRLNDQMPNLYTRLGELEATVKGHTKDIAEYRIAKKTAAWITKRAAIAGGFIVAFYLAIKTGDWSLLKRILTGAD